jgi:hypothetical protein
MAQTTPLSIPDSDGAAFLSNVNAKNAALFSSNSGPTAPSATVAGMFWFDESVSPAVLRIRNSSNTAWIRIIDTADAAAARTALGATTIGASVFTAADAAAARAALGATTTGASVFTAADAAAARAALGASPLPTSATALGQDRALNSGTGNALIAPSGGQWRVYWLSIIAANGSVASHGVYVDVGGGTIQNAVAGVNHIGFAWRIA